MPLSCCVFNLSQRGKICWKSQLWTRRKKLNWRSQISYQKEARFFRMPVISRNFAHVQNKSGLYKLPGTKLNVQIMLNCLYKFFWIKGRMKFNNKASVSNTRAKPTLIGLKETEGNGVLFVIKLHESKWIWIFIKLVWCSHFQI